MRSHSRNYLLETAIITKQIDDKTIESLADHLCALRGQGGRLFIAGLGGSAANASHAANDFRKLCGIEAYCLSDNVAELTARANDQGWDESYAETLKASKPQPKDALLVLSVGGGTLQVSLPVSKAIDFALHYCMMIFGIVGDAACGGYTKRKATVCVTVPTVEPSRITPHTEGFQSVILHCLVSHPKLQIAKTKW